MGGNETDEIKCEREERWSDARLFLEVIKTEKDWGRFARYDPWEQHKGERWERVFDIEMENEQVWSVLRRHSNASWCCRDLKQQSQHSKMVLEGWATITQLHSNTQNLYRTTASRGGWRAVPGHMITRATVIRLDECATEILIQGQLSLQIVALTWT